MKKETYRAVLAAVFILTSCATTPPTAQIEDSKSTVEDTRVFLEKKCPFSQVEGETEEFAFLAPLVTALIGVGIDAATTWASNKLATLANPPDTTVYANTAAWLWSFNKDSRKREPNAILGCLVIVHGKFGPNSSDESKFSPDWQEVLKDTDIATWNLQESPDFYFEAGFTLLQMTVTFAYDHSLPNTATTLIKVCGGTPVILY